jgi:phenylpropionate dioxygenase-like ring-hydroxylating dioxygenase large terminal subunit
MLDFIFNRRNFLRVGGISAAMSSIGLSDKAFSQEGFDAYEDKAVVWLWLGGGPTQFETFHAPTDTVPTEWQAVNGSIYDVKTNINLGADWTELAKHTGKMNVVNSFSHRDSSHRQGTHFMMTGQYNPERTTTSMAKYPSFGSIVSACYGANNQENGVPTYVKQGKIEGDEGAWLGGAYKPFDPSNKDNLTPRQSQAEAPTQ